MKINKTVNIRKATLEDAKSLGIFVTALDNESEYLLFEQGERSVNTETARQYLAKIESNKKSAVFIAENEECEIVGFVCGETSHLKRISHVMKINMGILKNYRKSAISRELLHALLDYAAIVGILRAEATVIKNNIISLNLCKKFGFNVEGIKKSALKIKDSLYDEYFLSLLL